MVGQKLALVVTVVGSILTTRRTGNRNYFFRTMASNERANPAGGKIPENENRNGTFRSARKTCAGDGKGCFGSGMQAISNI